MTLLPIVGFWALALWGFAGAGGRRLVTLHLALLPFGSLAVLPASASGGLALTPAPMLGALLVLRCALTRGGLAGMARLALAPRGMLLLAAYAVVAVVATAFLPRLFAGTIVMPWRGEVLAPTPLAPSAQNASQLAYLLISILVAIAYGRLLAQPGMRQHALRALALGGAVAVATGLLDLATAVMPVAPLLAPFRTAAYALHVSHVILGTKRVVGLMPEAAAFGLLCVGYLSLLYFLRRALPDGWLRRRGMPALMLGLLASIALSTSTAAYAGLSVLGAAAAAEWGWRAVTLRRREPGRRGLAPEAWAAIGGLAALAAVFAVLPHLLDPVAALLEATVVEKAASASFAERSAWTEVSWRAFLATGGLGLGVGSTRVSTSVVGVLAGTGVLGAGLYYGFILRTLTRRALPRDPEARLLLGGVRWAWLAPFASSLLTGIGADFGPFLAVLFGLGVAVSDWRAGARAAPRLAATPAGCP
ncbi:MAG: hypothetical protein QM699_05645 [Amaricoccus sp.]|uniref:hypothetical protein n=1 Tax=Amaricoccus sp. TaxID=1872485 RepID=UPI0039E38CC4